MNTQRYDDSTACPRCNEVDLECSCERLRELQASLASITAEMMGARQRQYRLSYDDAMAQRALREYGYTR